MYVIIPARFASSRLPGKPLRDICGKPLIRHVYERALASAATRIVIATDDARIGEVASAFGAEVCMTSAKHNSGTERIAEVVQKLAIPEDTIIVNLQGDEPLMPPALVRAVANTLATHTQAAMATAMHAITDEAMMANPNVVKVVCDCDSFALYFSRAPIPWRAEHGERASQHVAAFRHIGLYAYRAGFVTRYAAWPPSPLEAIERLEQLRVLWNGERIVMCQSSELPAAGVDTLEDLERVRKIVQSREGRGAGSESKR
jgi:3-deoxy-manno-octulosonate cytidylyltransferase (CMP-KDO synthetase)